MTDACARITGYLNCEYEVFTGNQSEEDLFELFYKLRERGKKDGFTPLFIIPDDTLAEAFELFLEDNEQEDSAAGMQRGIQEVLEQAAGVDVDEFMQERREEYTEMHADENIVGEFSVMEPTTELTLRDIDDELFPEIILAKIPAEAPALAAWAPMGGFNDCPSPAEQVAVFSHWQKKYGVIPAVVSYDVWQLTVERPPLTNEDAEKAAWEHFAFCYDIVMQAPEGFTSVRALASNLRGSTAWGFWWD